MTNEIYHHGILGQKWGRRRFQNSDGTLTDAGKQRYYKAQSKQASKDAKEYARAKMYYGEGAGTRRKLINNTVKERSKDEVYKKAFEEALANQNMSEHVQKAKAERKREDVKNSVKKTGRSVANVIAGHPERAAAGIAAVSVAAGVIHKTGADKKILEFAKKRMSDIGNSIEVAKGRREIAKWINNVKR